MTTIADMIAAAKIGAIDTDTEVFTSSEMTDIVTVLAPSQSAPAVLSSTVHECGIANCRHGNAHPLTSQPDRQVKLACTKCGAVARMTERALHISGGIRCQTDDAPFVQVARRVYTRKGN